MRRAAAGDGEQIVARRHAATIMGGFLAAKAATVATQQQHRRPRSRQADNSWAERRARTTAELSDAPMKKAIQTDRQLFSGPVPHPPRRFYVAPPPAKGLPSNHQGQTVGGMWGRAPTCFGRTASRGDASPEGPGLVLLRPGLLGGTWGAVGSCGGARGGRVTDLRI